MKRGDLRLLLFSTSEWPPDGKSDAADSDVVMAVLLERPKELTGLSDNSEHELAY
jgi:hypothetical protein